MTATLDRPRNRGERRRAVKASVSRILYRRPWCYPEQEAFLFCEERYSLVEASTKTGKTTGCIIWLNEKACLEGEAGRNGWWVAPIHSQAKIAYDRLKRYTRALAHLLKFNDTELSVVYPNGAKLWFKGADRPNSLYGDDVYWVVVDEASRMKEEAWYAVRSTLTATRGVARIIGNVKGRKNWYYKLARRAQAGEPGMRYAKLTAYHAVAAGVLSVEEVEDARRLLPADVFAELYLAEPTEDGSNPFGISSIAACLMPQLAPGEVVAHGIDLAKSVDWCVDVGLAADGRMAGFDRWQGPWSATRARILRRIGRRPALIDSTGVGDPVVEDLSSGLDTVTGFKFTSASKQQLMEGLALAIQDGAAAGRPWIYEGPGEVVKSELEAFEFVYTRTGVRYSAPAGQHDDTVCALALAVMQRGSLHRGASRGGRAVTL